MRQYNAAESSLLITQETSQDPYRNALYSFFFPSISVMSQQAGALCLSSSCSFSSVKWIQPLLSRSIRLSSSSNPISTIHLSMSSSLQFCKSYSAERSICSTSILRLVIPLHLCRRIFHSSIPPEEGAFLNVM